MMLTSHAEDVLATATFGREIVSLGPQPEPPPSKTLAIAQYLADDPTEGSVIPVTILDKKTGGKGYLAADINFDAQVNFKDLGLWMADWLKSTRAEDIGTTGGDAFYDPQTEVWTIHGNGADIWGTSDQFHYVYQQPGLCQLTVTVHSLEDTHEWAKAGVMARAELTTDSGYAMIVVTPHRGVAFQWRPGSGEETQSIHGGPAATITTPVSLRLVVNGDTATGYYYSNGSWVQLGNRRRQVPRDDAHFTRRRRPGDSHVRSRDCQPWPATGTTRLMEIRKTITLSERSENEVKNIKKLNFDTCFSGQRFGME
jgi:hypothetical protein